MKSFLIALSMYTKIPVPQIDWDSKNMKYVFLFFPLIGLIIGGVLVAWFFLAIYKDFNSLLFAAIATAIPLLITGGIHMDGLMDTTDALSSYGDIQKRQKILKDPHIGAFGAIVCCVYLLVQTGLWAHIYENPENLKFVAMIFIISRTITGVAVVSFQPAKDTGLAHMFSISAEKQTVKILLYCYLIFLCVVILALKIPLGLLSIVAVAILMICVNQIATKDFGGISGDLCGFLLQWIELILLLIAAFV